MIIGLFCIVIFSYIIFCGVLYYQQENLIFHPEKLPDNYQFEFRQKFQEMIIHTKDNINLHGILFTADSSRGLIFYLHGNAGSVASWREIAKIYTDLNYDIFILDYRGFGKSEGKISSEKQLHQDIQAAYDTLKATYPENKIIIIGYSIGTGPAARLASKNNPQRLILQAPYYSLIDILHYRYAYVPNFLLRYTLKTYKFLKKIETPVTIFHGEEDNTIYYGSSLKLKKHLKSTDTLITLKGQDHNGMNYNKKYQRKLKKIFNY
ncbi:MAG: alpha/beta fold hydrolase [bacterium]